MLNSGFYYLLHSDQAFQAFYIVQKMRYFVCFEYLVVALLSVQIEGLINMKQDSDFIDELPKAEQHVLHEHASLSPQLIFKIIQKEGEVELQRTFAALTFSGLAAGIFVSFSFLFRAIFHMYMANSPIEPLISRIGYTVGFLIVILGRMQLFWKYSKKLLRG